VGRGGFVVGSTRILLWVIYRSIASLIKFEGYIMFHIAEFDSHQPPCLEPLRNLCLTVRSRVVAVRVQVAALILTPVRLGNSGLKVSKIILGCMSYGKPQIVLLVFDA
jgi:hypothetical protein